MQRRSLIAGALSVAAAAPMTAHPAPPSRSSMSSNGQMMWFSAPVDLGARPVVYFSFGAGTGLTDIDFHPITERGWKAMASPAPDAVAVLQVPADATMAQVNAAVQAVATNGGYRYVQVVMRGP
jgi:hypothetical protein